MQIAYNFIQLFFLDFTMKQLLIMFIALLIAVPLYGAEEARLLKLRKADGKNSIQIYFSLNKTPGYSTKVKGKRVDVIIKGLVDFDKSFIFPTNEKIIKFLYIPRENKTVFTFFLRFSPQNVELTSPAKNILVLDILLGNPFTKTYPDLSSKLKGITVVTPQTKDFANPYVASPYKDNWLFFFSSYESKFTTSASIQYTLPDFPIISLLPTGMKKKPALIPQELMELAEQNLWGDMQYQILKLINNEQNIENKKLLVLTLGEILLREGNFAGAYRQLYLLEEKYRGELIALFAKYLLIRLKAEHESPYIADYEYRNLEPQIPNDIPLAPYIILAQIETALATQQYDKIKQLLARDDIGFPGITEKIRDLRQADYWHATGDFIKAFVGYNLLDKSKFIHQHLYSLNGYCDTLYHQKHYRRSAVCYQYLGGEIDNKEQLSMISLRKAMAELHIRNPADMYTAFSAIENTFPDTEAGYRAAIKKTDILFLTKPNFEEKSAQNYHALSQVATFRSVIEEASLKEAIIYRLMNKLSESIELLMEFQRNFRKSELRDTAQALLIEILPLEIKRLVKEEEYLKALVLAKKNKLLFANNWIDIELLSDIGQAYQELSIYDESKKLFLYLLDIDESDNKQNFYLPLIKTLFLNGEYDLVEDYAVQYFYQYPEGIHKNDILLLRLKSLMAEEKTQQAIDLLSDPLPKAFEFTELAADIYFLERDYEKVTEVLTAIKEKQDELPQDSLFILAESYYELGRYDKAADTYQNISEDNPFFDQTLFRLANIEEKNGREENALKLFQKIVEKGKSPLWQRLAQQELDLKKSADRF